MGKLVLWLGITYNTKMWTDSGELYTKTLETCCVPIPGIDDIQLYQAPDGESFLWSVKGRWMEVDGTWNVELTRMHINPTPEMEESISGSNRMKVNIGNFTFHHRTERVENPQEFEEKLRDSGWREYNP